MTPAEEYESAVEAYHRAFESYVLADATVVTLDSPRANFNAKVDAGMSKRHCARVLIDAEAKVRMMQKQLGLDDLGRPHVRPR